MEDIMELEDINLNLYRIFYVVANSKSYSDASNKLYISKTAISKYITQLEDFLDTKLFYRENNGVKLTADGNKLYQYVDEGLGSLNAGEKLIRQKNDLSTGKIIIGSLTHISAFYLMDRIEKVKKDYPNLKLKLINGATRKYIN